MDRALPRYGLRSARSPVRMPEGNTVWKKRISSRKCNYFGSGYRNCQYNSSNCNNNSYLPGVRDIGDLGFWIVELRFLNLEFGFIFIFIFSIYNLRFLSCRPALPNRGEQAGNI